MAVKLIKKKIPTAVLSDQDPSPTECTLVHPYPGSMPAYLASRLIDRYSSEGDTVFDPFCGSGSVLVEAAKQGRNVIGTDLLSTAVDIASAALHLPIPEVLEDLWDGVHQKALLRTSLFQQDGIDFGNLSESLQLMAQWFHPETFVEIYAIRNEIIRLEVPWQRDLLMLILGGALISLSKRVSRGVMHWGWVADNVKPRPDDLLKTSPFQELNRRVARLVTFMRATGSHESLSRATSEFFVHDWLAEVYADNTISTPVDLLITSPPYPYSIDYTLALRLTHYLRNVDSDPVRIQEIGARYKRKRKDRGEQYLSELSLALGRATAPAIHGARAVFVMHNPSEYSNVIAMTDDEWCDYLVDSMSGDWSFVEFGYRRCEQRRVINKKHQERSEFVAVFERK